jgi:UDP-N-acetylmuramoyl-L-alanyl-D-glutamate--2,6-diaminopimelate ligase
MSDIVSGIDPDFSNYVLIQNRKKAIEYIINQSEKNDVVILAGKGHETYQILQSETIEFDDREEARNAILSRLKKNPHMFNSYKTEKSANIA